jgi:hypothetical protein
MSDQQKSGGKEAKEQVGYGKPPKATQWQKGQSGNPNGKKKGTKNFATHLQKVATETVAVNEGGKLKKITLVEALAKAPYVHGMKGDKKNALYALQLVQEYGFPSGEKVPKPGAIWHDGSGKYYQSIALTPDVVAQVESLRHLLGNGQGSDPEHLE